MQVVIFSTQEMLGISPMASNESRCNYVADLIREIQYPVCTMPWVDRSEDASDGDPEWAGLRMFDVTGFYHELRSNLNEMGYLGEELIVSPSKGDLVLIYYFKGQS